MPYTRSSHRKDLVIRIDQLQVEARKAERRRRAVSADHREMIFQCAIFQASAAMETYLRLLIEGWVQKMSPLPATVPPSAARAYILAKQLDPIFTKFQFTGNEKALVGELSKPFRPWEMMAGIGSIPATFSGSALHDQATYPSEKNLNKLFARLGIPNMVNLISGKLGRDATLLIGGFQSVRTAIAHSSPPPIAINDVDRLLGDMKSLAAAIDRIFFHHVGKHGGTACWP